MRSPAELYACLYVKEFPAQALLRLRPDLRGKPAVVMNGEAPLEQVCSMTRQARTLGLEKGMSKAEVETFPAALMLTRSAQEETAARATLLECAGGFSPRVEEIAGDTVWACVLDISGTESLFGPPQTLAQDLLVRTRALGVAARIAVSRNFQAAVALARGLRKETGIIPAGDEDSALAPLPLQVLELSQEQADVLSLWGISSLGMLAELPEKELVARMGQAGRRLRQLARGEAPHLFRPFEPAFTLEEHMDLEFPVDVLDALLFVVNVMLEQLVLRASARVFALASVTVTLKLEAGGTHTRTVRPALPSNDRQLWLKLLQLDLEAHPPEAAILALVVKAEPGETDKVQLGLFSPQLPEPSRLDVTLARIRAIVGEGNVGCAVLKDTHRPDSFRMEPFRIVSAGAPECIAGELRPVLRRLRPAENVSVTLRAEQPASFVFRERRYTVDRAYGPWVKGGEWWSRDFREAEHWHLVARAADGVTLCCYLVRDLAQGAWCMAGLYD